MKIKSLLLIYTAVLVQSCVQSAKDPHPADGNGKLGYLVGKVTDQTGQGISGATVFIENTVLKGHGAEVKTGSKGRYQLPVVAGLGH